MNSCADCGDALDVNTFRWSRLWGPSPQIPPRQESEGRAEYPDGNPASVHTYDRLERRTRETYRLG